MSKVRGFELVSSFTDSNLLPKRETAYAAGYDLKAAVTTEIAPGEIKLVPTGVKAYMHLAKSDKLIQNIIYVLKNKNPMFNFIRWTPGEISLMKDIILHLNDINFDIANKTDRTGKFIASLKKLKKKYVKVGTFGVNKLAPFATIVISSATYRSIRDDYGFDLKNPTFSHKLMSELFLMAFVIIDDVNHTVDMLVDGQSDFQTYSLEMLEREVTMNSNKLGKELTRMLGSGM